MLRKAILLFIFFPITLFSQNSSYNSLDLNISSRILSLGGSVISIMDSDVSLACTTPSLLNSSMDKQIAFSFVDYVSDINFISAYFAKNISGNLMIFSGMEAINYGEFPSKDNIGNTLPNFSANEQVMTFGISKYLGSNFTLGSNLKILNSNLETYHSLSLSSNISTTYHLNEKDFTCTFLLKNIGRTIITYTNEKESFPFEIQMGFSKSLKHLPFRYSVVLHHLNVYDISNRFNPKTIYDPITDSMIIKKETVAKKMLRHVIIGCELNPFKKSFYLRSGFNFQRREDLKLASVFTMSGFSWGLGFGVKKIQINYARSAFHRSSMINSFSVMVNLSTFGL